MAQIKTKSEIAKIARACEITDQIFKKIISRFTWKTETELRDFIAAEIARRGLKPSFPPIVTSGSRAGNEIHPKSTNTRLEGFVIIDFGVMYQKYMSDMTRTIFVGTPTKQQTRLYELLLKSKQEAEKLVLKDVKAAFSDLKAREVLGKFNKYFIHTLGHGVGTRIHEAPRIYWRRTRPYFREHMVVTVEPGIYIPNMLGMRIEDTGVVTKAGFVPLTRSSLKLIVVPLVK
jgi:Xaa-Pro aminopeptidase